MITKQLVLNISAVLFFGLLEAATLVATPPLEINGPGGTSRFGDSVAVLPNGNVVVTDPSFGNTIGAVFLYRKNGEMISQFTGLRTGDLLGSGGITVLANGNFVISSPKVDVDIYVDAGAVTLGFADTGVSGTVSASNSTVGNYAQSQVGQVTALPDGNFVIGSPFWNGNRGAATWRSGSTVMGGAITAANSVVGESADDYLAGIVVLPSGKYIIHSYNWGDGGAVSLCANQNGCKGTLTTENALIGAPGDYLGGGGIVILKNGNYVIASPSSNGGRGMVTLANGSIPTVGTPSAANSLVGTTANSHVGNGGVFPLSNGNYVVLSTVWLNSAGATAGAATFGNGETGVTGAVDANNSLIGNEALDFSYSTVVPLTNGNYVVSTPNAHFAGRLGAATWGNGQSGISGPITPSNSLSPGPREVLALTNGNYVVVSDYFGAAATWASGETGIIGNITAANSLVGIGPSGSIGGSGSGSVSALSNGNYVFAYPYWDDGAVADVGAAVLCSGTQPTIGVISASNSLHGTATSDRIGWGGVTALKNGNYVVRSDNWNSNGISSVGAVTFGDGSFGTTGPVSAANSLIGSSSHDQVGSTGIRPLANGNYVVTTISWNNVGAVTLGNGTFGTSGPVSASNSFVGSAPSDRVGTVGNNNSVVAFSDGSFAFSSEYWNNGSVNDAGAITFGNGRQINAGPISVANSVLGTLPSNGGQFVYHYSPQARILAVGHRGIRRVTLIFNDAPSRAPFDFDGDGRSDVSIFRPSTGQWWLARSTAEVTVQTFGNATDTLVPADFTGDGKADVAIWRNGEWFVQRSDDYSFYSFPFGTAGDIPVPGDYDGDGKADAAVYRPSESTWYILRSSGGVTIESFGAAGDRPVPADYDGDGKTDIAIFRPSEGQWWLNRSAAGVIVYPFGNSADRNVPSDYTGDGKADVAIWRPSTGEWFILRSEDASFYSFPFGISTDVPVPGDYDGDGKFDAGVFRPSNGTWYLNRSTAGTLIQGFGLATDLPVPNSSVR